MMSDAATVLIAKSNKSLQITLVTSDSSANKLREHLESEAKGYVMK